MTGRAAPVVAPAVAGDSRLFRTVLGAFATGVTVVTVGGARPHGMTANAFASVSLDPPLVLVCIDRKAIMHEVMAAAEYFAVSVLAASQEGVARHFADDWRPQGRAQFESVDWSPGEVSGAPLIRGAAAWLECALWRSYDGGDHTIVLGRSLAMGRRADEDALLFHGGRFRRFAEET
ncbi:flavin reductase family protein [Actinomadura livida]|uniref:Flavin reductase (DIM6/NTAB) family NADH-FMN oxidoreductase RutF n=1 Tax=Actinomadura livida TaxID=79909 RepID=A0A7W7ID09_9ACTN|nr:MULTISPECIES: flavin reductase family protein [Actinomadura]MBB4774780.1 flavin reductase (DIM6/NTAB) family NADH-FMN oxidoreductase RutF [Actinomadura catellatispora]GGU06031.1 hypothetical protein GCM10010208_32930 [Actinomadura livida]